MTSVAFQPCEITHNHITDLTRSTERVQIQSMTPAFQAGAAEAASNQNYVDEIEKLRRQVRAMQERQNRLEAEKEELINQVCDLKALTKRVAKEGEKNLQHFTIQNRYLQQRVSSLSSALEYSFEHSHHFDQVCEYWEMLE